MIYGETGQVAHVIKKTLRQTFLIRHTAYACMGDYDRAPRMPTNDFAALTLDGVWLASYLAFKPESYLQLPNER